MEIKLLIGASDEAVWQALVEALELEDPSIRCAVTGLNHVVARAAAIQPDVILVESAGGWENTRQLMRGIRSTSPAARILMIYQACTHELVIGSVKEGACGCLLKTSSPSLYAKAVQTVHRGETWYGRVALLQALRNQLGSQPPSRPADEEKLTPREEEIVHLIGCGLSNKEIGRRLDISDMTVKTHLHHVYVKLRQSGRYKAFLNQSDATSPGFMRLDDEVRPFPVSPAAGELREL